MVERLRAMNRREREANGGELVPGLNSNRIPLDCETEALPANYSAR